MLLELNFSYCDIFGNFINFAFLNPMKYIIKVYQVRIKTILITPNQFTRPY